MVYVSIFIFHSNFLYICYISHIHSFTDVIPIVKAAMEEAMTAGLDASELKHVKVAVADQGR